jgi:hypothetical protein
MVDVRVFVIVDWFVTVIVEVTVEERGVEVVVALEVIDDEVEVEDELLVEEVPLLG